MIGKLLVLAVAALCVHAGPNVANPDHEIQERLGLNPNGCPINPLVALRLPHETKCNRYYQCVLGLRVLKRCSLLTQFSATLQTCVLPRLAKCTLGGSDSDEESDESLSSSESEAQGKSDESTSSNESDAEGQSNESNPEFLPNGCPADFSVHLLLPHETDCRLFYQCNFEDTVLKRCARGTYFSNELQVCVRPEDSDCKL